MYKNINIIEVTKENEQQYLSDIVELEKSVLEKMEQEGRIGQLFITEQEGISEYINSDYNHVMVAVKNEVEPKVISATYITQGQIDFTYNDITKYFKCGSEYQKYVKSQYTENEYKRAIREVYVEKICAFKYARDLILKEFKTKNTDILTESQKNSIFLNMVKKEFENPKNKFHEKSQIRDDLNKYMTLYMKVVKKDLERYQQFYWVDFDYLKKNLTEKNQDRQNNNTKYEGIDSTIATYDRLLQLQMYKIYDKSHCTNMNKYYTANTANTVELDTYITRPDSRENGMARILVLEGIKKSIEDVLKNKDNNEIFLVSTLHEDNLSSKYVSDFFGLTDYLFVNRRSDRDRQVHIHKIERDDAYEYIARMEKKIAVLYGYNPNKIKITKQEEIRIIKEQYSYEVCELDRLNNLKDISKKRMYEGYIKGKKGKIEKLGNLLMELDAPEL